ncbi:WD repeat-containing protein 76 isoform X2 [Astatotilapia calliptera]|uniref:WD repeat-containing protein 76 isoform X2 n=1 Tax=Astatotilapia calliptera TaxID=8154 RepID=UPI000D325AE1|nr:WD repeat-containing protein 76 isoform X2 [Maylandia zebra]XP_026028027.1 WD repeat-containing protein 76 isoform X2 [Astatotilapia calliptera]
MATLRTKREAVVLVKEMTPENLEATVRRSSRNGFAPKRLQYSPEHETPKKKRKTKAVAENGSQNKQPKDEEDAENSDVEHAPEGYGRLSAYELERLENIRQNQAFLSSINLFQATEEFKQLTRPKPSQRGLTRAHAAVKEVVPPRKSLRLQKKEAEILELPPEPRGTLIYEQSSPAKKPSGPLPMDPVNVEEGSKLPPQLLELCSEDVKVDKKIQLDLKGYRSSLKNMTINEDKVAKVVKDRIFSATFHPCTSSLLLAAGDKWGKVGLWKLGGDWGEDGVLLFEPHTRPVGCMAFSKSHPTQLLSLSYDGSLRCMDVEKAVFDDVYDIEDGLKTFDFMSHDCSTLVVGNWYGEVAIVDRRTPGNSHESLHTLDPKTLRCVNVHPLQKQYFVVAESKIYDTSTLTTKSPLLTTIRHDMQTGRWLTKLSAAWDPKLEDCFVVGSMMKPRRVQVFHESGQLQHSFMDSENLSTVLSVTAFHPTRNALLGGNASGRLHVFSD